MTVKFTVPSFQAFRTFSTTVHCHATHYETLNVHKGASKAAIKASYYKLSKRYHPDISKDPNAKAIFQAVSEAWSTLGDDRRRRAYDHDLSTRPPPSHMYDHPYYDTSSMYETRRRGATHAWENARRARTHARHQRQRPPPPPFSQHDRRNPFGGVHRSGTVSDENETFVRDPWESAHVRRATGRGDPFTTPEDELRKESIATRFAQVIGMVFFIVVLTGGFGRHH